MGRTTLYDEDHPQKFHWASVRYVARVPVGVIALVLEVKVIQVLNIEVKVIKITKILPWLIKYALNPKPDSSINPTATA